MPIRSTAEVAELLEVADSTLRRWSRAFSAHLSPAPSAGANRAYTDDDVEVLRRARDLVAVGLTLDEAASELIEAELSKGLARAVPAVPARALSDGLQAIVDGQRTILDSQQVNRDLLGVVIQDNFNLKEENARMRERMMRLEQELGDLRKRDGRYGALKERIKGLERGQADDEGRGWLARFFGF